MSYSVTFLRRAQRALDRLSARDAQRLLEAIATLAATPRPPGSRKLRERDAWRIRVGDFRVIYTVDDGLRKVVVLDLGHRRDIYR